MIMVYILSGKIRGMCRLFFFFFFFFLTARTCSCRADKRWKKLRQVSLGIVGGLRLTRPDWPGSAGIYTNLCL